MKKSEIFQEVLSTVCDCAEVNESEVLSGSTTKTGSLPAKSGTICLPINDSVVYVSEKEGANALFFV